MGRSQIGDLTPDYKSLQSKGQIRYDWRVLYTIGKTFPRPIRYFPRTLNMHELKQVCHFVMGFPTWAKCKFEMNWPTSLFEAIMKVEGLSNVG